MHTHKRASANSNVLPDKRMRRWLRDDTHPLACEHAFEFLLLSHLTQVPPNRRIYRGFDKGPC